VTPFIGKISKVFSRLIILINRYIKTQSVGIKMNIEPSFWSSSLALWVAA
jgi:hypothetical protein